MNRRFRPRSVPCLQFPFPFPVPVPVPTLAADQRERAFAPNGTSTVSGIAKKATSIALTDCEPLPAWAGKTGDKGAVAAVAQRYAWEPRNARLLAKQDRPTRTRRGSQYFKRNEPGFDGVSLGRNGQTRAACLCFVPNSVTCNISSPKIDRWQLTCKVGARDSRWSNSPILGHCTILLRSILHRLSCRGQDSRRFRQKLFARIRP